MESKQKKEKRPGEHTSAFIYLSFVCLLIGGGSLGGIEVRTLGIGLLGPAVERTDVAGFPTDVEWTG